MFTQSNSQSNTTQSDPGIACEMANQCTGDRHGRWRGVAALMGLVLLLAGMTGCYPNRGAVAYAIEANRIDQETNWSLRSPYLRMGDLPFAIPFVPLHLVEADELGQHAYRWGRFYSSRGDEVSRGLVYTRRAGVIDLAHTRNAIDLTRYAHLALQEAMADPTQPMAVKSSEPSVYLLRLHPDALVSAGALLKSEAYATAAVSTAADASQAIPQATFYERGPKQDAVQCILAQRLAYTMLTWHELATYFGYKGAWVFPEFQSSFTWDDQASHLFGVMVAGHVLASFPETCEETPEGELAFEQHVTQTLNRMLDALEPVDPETAEPAIQAMEGVWFDGSKPLKRLVYIGLDGQPFHPWLCDDASVQPHSQAVVWHLADLSGGDETEAVSSASLHARDCMELVIEPYIFESKAMLKAAKAHGDKSTIDPEVDFAVLKDHIEAEEAKQ